MKRTALRLVRTTIGRALVTLVILQNFAFALPAANAATQAGTVVRPMIAADYAHSLALRSDGTVWAWGDNSYGQLGDGTGGDFTDDFDSNVPVQVTGLVAVAVAAGESHSLALKADGTVWAWGYNGYGQLGNGGEFGDFSNVPVPVSGLTGVTAIAAGGWNSLALRSDGTVWAWGSNFVGQLGDGTTDDSNIPVQVLDEGGMAPLTNIIAITSGASHSLALRSDGTVWAWGWNGEGQLGDGTASFVTFDEFSNVPVQVTGLAGVAAIAAGHYHSLALRSDGTVWAWGCSMDGQLGDGTGGGGFTHDFDSNVPVQVVDPGDDSGFLTGVTAIAAGYEHSLALRSDGTVWAWGDNWTGQLGDGTGGITFDEFSNVPVPVSTLTGVTAIAGGGAHSLALRSDGTVRAWGWNSEGQLGDGTNDVSNVPAQSLITLYVGPAGVIAIAAGLYHSLALKADGTVWAWGFNGTGDLGDGTNDNSNVPVQASGLTGIAAVAAGDSFSLALRSDGTVWAWGLNHVGQLGDGTGGDFTDDFDSNVPVQVVDPGDGSGFLTGVTAIAAGSQHSLALKSDGTVRAWGWNLSGELGDGNGGEFEDISSVPVQVAGLAGATAVAAGGGRSLAIDSDGALWAWGDGTSGGLGNGAFYSSSLTPIQVHGPGDVGFLTGVTAVSAGLDHSLALRSDGTAWAWGNNYYGQLGDGSTADSNVPVQVHGPGDVGFLTGVTFVASGYALHSLALRSDGTAWAWGGGGYGGALGNNHAPPDSDVPVQVHGPGDVGFLTGVTAIAGGYTHSLALGSDGAVWAWGFNDVGQLGNCMAPGGVPEEVDWLGAVCPDGGGGGPSGPNTTDNAVVLSRVAVNAQATATIFFTLNDTLSSQLTLTFDPAFTNLDATDATAETPSSPGCVSNFQNVDGNTFTADKTDCTGAVIISGVHVTNPGVAGPYLVSWVNDDEGYAMVAIVDSDQVTVMASVDPTIAFDLDTNTTGDDASAPYSVALGALTVGAVSHSDNDSVNSIFAQLETNATGGAIVTVLSANAALRSASFPSDLIPNAVGTMSAGTANYGLCVNSATPPSAATGTFQASAPYDAGTCDPAGDENDVQELSDAIPTPILDSASAPLTGGTAEIVVNAAIDTSTPAHSDYTDTLTFVATGTF